MDYNNKVASPYKQTTKRNELDWFTHPSPYERPRARPQHTHLPETELAKKLSFLSSGQQVRMSVYI